jgi:hypothetical protein
MVDHREARRIGTKSILRESREVRYEISDIVKGVQNTGMVTRSMRVHLDRSLIMEKIYLS